MFLNRSDRTGAGRSVRVAAIVGALSLVPALAAQAADRDTDLDGTPDVSDCKPYDPAVAPGKADKPDLAFEDTNCDLIDGDAADAVFVASSGSDSGTGTRANPFATVQKGVDVALASARDVYVAGGTFSHVTMPATADGVGLYGGYSPADWSRTPTTEPTTITGSPEALLLDGATGVVVQLLTLDGSRGASSSAYGVRAVNGSSISLERTAATAGPGGAGSSASGYSFRANAGGAGGAGGNGDCDGAGGGGGFAGAAGGAGAGAGGSGGSGRVGDTGTNGTTGGSALSGPLGGSGGGGGSTSGNASAGQKDGGSGAFGSSGAIGAGGAGGANSLVTAGAAWAGSGGGYGASGRGGSGGGGGGGGGGQNDIFTIHGGGGGGAGGGGGGAGGAGGGGGGAGGGSFGAYLAGATTLLVLDGSLLQSGVGGAGGAGAAGQLGGLGGAPGTRGQTINGADCNDEVGWGGLGGFGGAGGQGGGGGGGAGGPAGGIFRVDSPPPLVRDSQVQPEVRSGGSGGAAGNGAAIGATGQSAAQLSTGTSPSPADFDTDAVSNETDSCPTVPGPGTADGCPSRPPLDTTPPVPAITAPTSSNNLPAGISVTWTATDTAAAGSFASGPSRYDVRYRMAAWNGQLGDYVYPVLWQDTTLRSSTLTGAVGTQYCFSTRAGDAAGNLSDWSGERCTARPLDDRALAASSGWKRTAGSGFYERTITTSAKKGAVLTRTGVIPGPAALVATRCSTCGKVSVIYNGRTVKTVDLATSRTRRQSVIALPNFTANSGKVQFKVITTGKSVQIDGFVITR
jgi:hypothetical protein